MEKFKYKELVKSIFFLSFLFSFSFMFFSREYLIPKMLSSVNGHINGDPQVYHAIAMKKAMAIKAQGFKEFELRPEGQGAAGVASLIYLVSTNPYGIVLTHAFSHAVSTLLMFLILRFWFSDIAALIGIIPIAISPYMMFWFSQLNKDSFTLTGVLFFLYGLISLVKGRSSFGKTIRSLSLTILGVFLIAIMRPYVNQMLMPITILCIFTVTIWAKFNKVKAMRFLISSFILIICLNFLSTGAKSDQTLKKFEKNDTEYNTSSNTNGVVEKCFSSIMRSNWKDEKNFPPYLNDKLRALMGQRCNIFTLLDKRNNPTTIYSILDFDRFPHGAFEALLYFPRALVIGVMSPFPSSWLYSIQKRRSTFYSVVPCETIIYYLGLLALGIWISTTKKGYTIFIPIIYSIIMMTVTAMANPSVAVLYRYRFPWWMMLSCIGLAAMTTLSKSFYLQYHSDLGLKNAFFKLSYDFNRLSVCKIFRTFVLNFNFFK